MPKKIITPCNISIDSNALNFWNAVKVKFGFLARLLILEFHEFSYVLNKSVNYKKNYILYQRKT